MMFMNGDLRIQGCNSVKGEGSVLRCSTSTAFMDGLGFSITPLLILNSRRSQPILGRFFQAEE
jgi:hypothetical protein